MRTFENTQPMWEHGVEAMNLLGVALEGQGRGDEAATWWRRAAAAGHPVAAYNLGLWHRERGENAKALACFQVAAESGDSDAAYALGLLYLTLADHANAQRWLRRAAASDDPEANNALGALALAKGDVGTARQRFEQAAETGAPAAAYNLALLLRERIDELGPAAASEAAHWLTQAAIRGDADAAFLLGEDALRRDDVEEAEARFRLATQHGHERGRLALIELLRQRGAHEAAAELGA